jgi:hypothetical protein
MRTKFWLVKTIMLNPKDKTGELMRLETYPLRKRLIGFWTK